MLTRRIFCLLVVAALCLPLGGMQSYLVPHGPRGGADFLPTDVADIWTWYKPEDLPGSGAIATWDDASGNGRDATQTTEADKPIVTTSALDGFSSATFDGTAQHFDLPSTTGLTTAQEVFIVIKVDVDPPAANPQTGLWLLGTANSLYPFTNGLIFDSFGNTVRRASIDPGADLDVWRLYNVTSAANDWENRLDNVSIHTEGTNTVAGQASPKIGDVGGGVRLDGQVVEFILYSAKLSSGDRTLVVDYFSTKFPSMPGI